MADIIFINRTDVRWNDTYDSYMVNSNVGGDTEAGASLTLGTNETLSATNNVITSVDGLISAGVAELLASSNSITSSTDADLTIGVVEVLTAIIDVISTLSGWVEMGVATDIAGVATCVSTTLPVLSLGVVEVVSSSITSTSVTAGPLLTFGTSELMTSTANVVSVVNALLDLGVSELLASTSVNAATADAWLQLGIPEPMTATAICVVAETTKVLTMGIETSLSHNIGDDDVNTPGDDGSLFIDGEDVLEDENGNITFAKTGTGNLSISTDAFKYGNSSVRMEGNASNRTYSGYGTSIYTEADYTIDFWYNSDYHSYGTVAGVWLESHNNYKAWKITKDNYTTLTYHWMTSDYVAHSLQITNSFVEEEWAHIAVTRSGGVVRIFVNGVQTNSVSEPLGMRYFTGRTLFIGYSQSDSTYYSFIDGYVDQFRIKRGSALWSSGFNVDSLSEMFYDIYIPETYVVSNTESLLTIGVTEVLGSTDPIVSTVSAAVLTLGIGEDLSATDNIISDVDGDMDLGIIEVLTATAATVIPVNDSSLTLGIQEATASTGAIVSTVLDSVLTMGTATPLAHTLINQVSTNTGVLYIDGESVIEDENSTHTITNDNVTINTSVKKYGNSSLYFNEDSSLTIQDHTDFAFGTGNFTIDFWIKTDDFINQYILNSQQFYDISLAESSSSRLRVRIDGSATILESSSGFDDGEWHHIAVVRTGTGVGETLLFIDGVIDDTGYLNNDLESFGPFQIGNRYNGSNELDGYLDNFRITKGTALWTAAFDTSSNEEMHYEHEIIDSIMNESVVSSFLNLGVTEVLEATTSPDTLVGTPDLILGEQELLAATRATTSNTIAELTMGGVEDLSHTIETIISGELGDLFIDGESIIEDESGTHTITNSNVVISTSEKAFGSSSMYFDRDNNAFISIPAHTDFEYGTGAFTIDFWAKGIKGDYWYQNDNFLIKDTGGDFKVDFGAPELNSDTNLDDGSWHHVAIVREGTGTNETKLYVDGLLEDTTTVTENFGAAGITYIGTRTGAGDFTDGYIDNFRSTKGTALWTAEFGLTESELKYYEEEEVTYIVSSSDAVAILGIQELLSTTDGATSNVTGSIEFGGAEALTGTTTIVSNASAVTIVFGVVEILSAVNNVITSSSGLVTLGITELLASTIANASVTDSATMGIGAAEILTSTACQITTTVIVNSIDLGGSEALSHTIIPSGYEGPWEDLYDKVEYFISSESDGLLLIGEGEILTSTVDTVSVVSDINMNFGEPEPMTSTASIVSTVTSALILGLTEDLSASIGPISTTSISLLDLGVTEILADVDNALVSNVTGELTLGGGIESLAHTLFEFTSGPVDPYIVSSSTGLVDLGVDEILGASHTSTSTAEAVMTTGGPVILDAINNIVSNVDSSNLILGIVEELSDECVAWTSISGLLTTGISEIMTVTSISNSVADAELTLGITEPIAHSITTLPGQSLETGDLFIDGESVIQDENAVHTITPVGNAAVSTDQYCPQGNSISSIALVGDGDYLTIPDHTDWDFGTGNFTIDTWVRFNSLTDQDTLFSFNKTALGSDFFMLRYSSTLGIDVISKQNNIPVVSFNQGNTSGWTTGVWYHVALVRNGTNWTIYRDGVSVASTVSANPFPTYVGEVGIGVVSKWNNRDIDGYMDNVRITKGTALWTSNFDSSSDEELHYETTGLPEPYAVSVTSISELTLGAETPLSATKGVLSTVSESLLSTGIAEVLASSTFSVSVTSAELKLGIDTPLTSTIGAVSNISSILTFGVDEFLTHTSPSDNLNTGDLFIGDGISDVNGTHNPFSITGVRNDYSIKKYGVSSMHFDGIDDMLGISTHNDFNLGTNDFTIDTWVRFESIGDINPIITKWGESGQRSFSFTQSYGQLRFGYRRNNVANNNIYAFWTPLVDTWYHIAVTRANDHFYLFIDGEMVKEDSIFSGLSIDYTTPQAVNIGRLASAPTYLFNGHIDNLRFINGEGLWDSSFDSTDDTALFYKKHLVVSNTVAPLYLGVTEYVGSALASQSITSASLSFGGVEQLSSTSSAIASCEALLSFGIVEQASSVTVFTSTIEAELTLGGPVEISATVSNSTTVSISNLELGIDEPLTASKLVQSNVHDAAILFGVNELMASTSITASTTDASLIIGGDEILSHTGALVVSNTSSFITMGVVESLSATNNVTINTSGLTPSLGVDEVLSTNVLAQSVVTPVLTMGGMEMLSSTVGPVSTTSIALLDLGVSEILGSVDGIVSNCAANLTLGAVEDLSFTCTTNIVGSPGDLFIDGEEIIEDETGTHTITNHGTPTITTSESAQGNSSIYFDGDDDYLTIPDHSDWNFGSGEFTLDFWVNFNNVNSQQAFISQGEDGTNRWGLRLINGRLQFSTEVSGVYHYRRFDWTPSTSTWYHVAVIRRSSNIYFFVDGTSIGSSFFTDSIDLDGDLLIGILMNSGGGLENEVDGYMDNIRITKGTALWTSNFDIETDLDYPGKTINTYVADSDITSVITMGADTPLTSTINFTTESDSLLTLGITELMGTLGFANSVTNAELTMGIDEPLAHTIGDDPDIENPVTYTIDQCEGGTTTVSSISGSYFGSNAFDNDTNSFWNSDDGTGTEWIKYDFGSGNEKTIRKYILYPYTSTKYTWKDFIFQGSNNNSSWDDLDVITNRSGTLNTEEFLFSNNTSYRYYRFYLTADNNTANTQYVAKEIEMMEALTYADESYVVSNVTADLGIPGALEELSSTIDIVSTADASTLDTGVVELMSAFRMIWSQIHTPVFTLGITELVSSTIVITSLVGTADLIKGLAEMLSSTSISNSVADADLTLGIGEYLEHTLDVIPAVEESWATVDSCEGGTPIEDYHLSSYPIDNAFDGIISSYYPSNTYYTTIGHWGGYDFGEGNEKRIGKYTIQIQQYPGYTASDWRFQGSDDGIDWDTVHTVTGYTWTTVGEKQTWTFENNVSYRMYRWFWDDSNSNGHFILTELEMMEYTPAAAENYETYAATTATALLSTGEDELLASSISSTGVVAGELIFGLIEVMSATNITTSMTIGQIYAGLTEIMEGTASCESETGDKTHHGAKLSRNPMAFVHNARRSSKGGLFKTT